MVSFGACQAEDSLLEDSILLIPEGEGKAEAALTITDAQQTILPPPVGTAAGMVVREVVPAAVKEKGKVPSWALCLYGQPNIALATSTKSPFIRGSTLATFLTVFSQ